MTKDLVNELEILFRDYGVLQGKGRRFPAPVKSRIIAIMQGGVSLGALSRATGISKVTLGLWKEKARSYKFKKIDIVSPPLAQNDSKFRLFIGENAWIELDTAAIKSGILQKIRSAI